MLHVNALIFPVVPLTQVSSLPPLGWQPQHDVLLGKTSWNAEMFDLACRSFMMGLLILPSSGAAYTPLCVHHEHLATVTLWW